MSVTIVRDDNMVYVDGRPEEVNCAELPADVHAVRWGNGWGEIEYRTVICSHCGTQSRKPNARIDNFTPYEGLVAKWHAARQQAEAKIEAVRAAAEAAKTAQAAAEAARIAEAAANAS